MLADEKLSGGLRYTQEDVVNYLGNSGMRQRINHLTIDPQAPGIRIITKKAGDAVDARESVFTQAQEEITKGKNVIAAVNGDSFDIDVPTGVSRSINVTDGYVFESQPYDNYNKGNPAASGQSVTTEGKYNYQTVMYMDTNGKFHAGPLNSNAHVTVGGSSFDVTPLNRSDFTYCAQNEGYRAFTACLSKDHVLRYTNSRNAGSGLTIPRTVRYAVVRIDPVNGSAFRGLVKAGQPYTGTVVELKKTDNMRIGANTANTGTRTEFAIPENCIVIAGYTAKLPSDAGYENTKAAEIEKLRVGQAVTYQCDLYAGYGFSTSNNGGPLTGTNPEDRLTNVDSAICDFNTLALNGVRNIKNNSEVMKRSNSNTARTMVGLESEGTLHILTVDSPSAMMKDSCGTTYQDITEYMMTRLHCTDVFAMDGGGSTTMVARRAGDSSLSIVNTPSDGSPRLVGNSILILSTSPRTAGQVAQVVLGTDRSVFAKSVFPFRVKFTDANGNPISASGKAVHFTAENGSITSGGVYTAPDQPCVDTVTAEVDGVSASVTVKVLNSFTEARISPDLVSLRQGDCRQFTLNAYDAEKGCIYIDPSLAVWSLSNPAVGSLSKNGILTVKARSGESDVTAQIAGKTYKTHLYVGLDMEVIEDFEADSISAWHLDGYLMSGAKPGQRGGQENGGDKDKYIADVFRNGNHALRVTALSDNWTDRSRNGTVNIFPDWDSTNQHLSKLPWTEQQRAAMEIRFTAKALPKKFGMWVYSPDSSHNGIRSNKDCMLTACFLQNCPGSKAAGYDSQPVSLRLADSIDWIGWKWVETDIPQTWDMPVVFNWMYFVNISKATLGGVKNELFFDDLTFLYGDSGKKPPMPPKPDGPEFSPAPAPVILPSENSPENNQTENGTGLGKTFLSDTHSSLTVNGSYLFKLTSLDGKEPRFTVGTPGIFRTECTGHSGDDYFFRLIPIGKPGSCAGIYVNGGSRLLIASVGQNFISDTTGQFFVKAGKTYQFRITAENKPYFTDGTPGVFRVEYAGNKGHDYFYRITAIGKTGSASGFYINRSEKPIAVAKVG